MRLRVAVTVVFSMSLLAALWLVVFKPVTFERQVSQGDVGPAPNAPAANAPAANAPAANAPAANAPAANAPAANAPAANAPAANAPAANAPAANAPAANAPAANVPAANVPTANAPAANAPAANAPAANAPAANAPLDVPEHRSLDSAAPRGNRYLIVGGGPTPAANELSIESDVASARSVLGPRGIVLFGGGADLPHVQVTGTLRGDPLKIALGELFSPRRSREAVFRKPTVSPVGPADETTLFARLDALSGAEPTLIVLHGHGDQGDTPATGSFLLWGGTALTPTRLAERLDLHAQTPVRVIASSCFSGSFAELVFEGGIEAEGPARQDRCGLFASTWDLEAAGCDSDPAARARDGYGVGFWGALAGRRRDGTPLPLVEVDVDGDGRVSLLEAHTWVRIESPAADVPTTTSERWLRREPLISGHEPVASGQGPAIPLPEEDAVIAALSRRLGYVGRLDAALGAMVQAEDAIASMKEDLVDAEEATNAAWSRLSGVILAEVPVADDPWHPDFDSAFAEKRSRLEALIFDSPEAAAWSAARDAEGRIADLVHQTRLSVAPLERLARAIETRRLAYAVAGRGGNDRLVYERLLRCERTVLQAL